MEIIYQGKIPRVCGVYFLVQISQVRARQRQRLTLSVAIFIHSSKFARIGTRFMGVEPLPATMAIPWDPAFSLSWPLGVRGLPEAPIDLRILTGEAAALMEFICIS